MYITTPEFQRVVQGPSHDAPVFVEIERDGRIVRKLAPTEGSVEINKYNAVRRTCTFKVADSDGDLVPGGLDDDLSIGSVARPYRGAVIPSVARATASYGTEAAWDTGTHTDTVSTPDGGLTL